MIHANWRQFNHYERDRYLSILLDRRKVHKDDPGQDTPALVVLRIKGRKIAKAVIPWSNEKPVDISIKTTTIKAKPGPLFLQPPPPPTDPNPIRPDLYIGRHGTEYNKAGVRRAGWCSIPQLEFLKGRVLDEVVMAYVHALRPSRVRIVEDGIITLDARLWRVTIFVARRRNKLFVTSIEQEVEVTLPKGVAHGDALSLALKRGVNSPEVKWHRGQISLYLSTMKGYFKQTSKGTFRFNFPKAGVKHRDVWLNPQELRHIKDLKKRK